jgi:hypothetical protein
VNGQYEAVTSTHEQGSINVGALGAGSLDVLNLQEIVTLPEYFMIPLVSFPRTIRSVQANSLGFVPDSAMPRGFSFTFNQLPYPSLPGPRPPLQHGQRASWFFGETLQPRSAMVLLTHPAGATSVVRFGLLGTNGATVWSAPVSVPAGAQAVSSPLPHGDGVGLTMQVFGSLPSQRAVIDLAGQPFELAGSLSSVIVPGPWRQVGVAQSYTVFGFTKPPVPISAITASGRRVPVEVLSGSSKSEQVRVRAPGPVSLIRSVAWDAGWKASVSVNGGSSHAVSVGSFDLVQQVRIPAGDDVVTFHYTPPHLRVATVLTVGATLLLVLLGVVWLVRRRRRPAMASQEEVPAEEGVLVQQYG